MLAYSSLYAKNNFSEFLKKVKELHEVLIEDENGVRFIVKLLPDKDNRHSPSAVDLNLSRDEIVGFVRETRRRAER